MPIILTSLIPTQQSNDPYPYSTLNINQSNTVFEDAAGTILVNADNDPVGLVQNILGSTLNIGEPS